MAIRLLSKGHQRSLKRDEDAKAAITFRDSEGSSSPSPGRLQRAGLHSSLLFKSDECNFLV